VFEIGGRYGDWREVREWKEVQMMYQDRKRA
jgi:hypothetical protein